MDFQSRFQGRVTIMDKNGQTKKPMHHVAADPVPSVAAAGARKTTRPSIATHSQKASLIFSTADPGGGGSRGGVPTAVTNSQAVTAVMHIPPVPINDIIPAGRRRAAVPQLPGVHGVLPGLPDAPKTGVPPVPIADSIGSYGSVSDRSHHYTGITLGSGNAPHPVGAASRKHYGDHSNPSVNVANILAYDGSAASAVQSPSARGGGGGGASHAGQVKRKPTIHDLFGAPPPVGSLGGGAGSSPRTGAGGHKVNASWGAPPVGGAMMNPAHVAAVQATMQQAVLRQQMMAAAAAGGGMMPALYGAAPNAQQFAAYQHALQMQAAAYAYQQQQQQNAAAAAAASAPNSYRGENKSPRSVSKPKRSESKRQLEQQQQQQQQPAQPQWVPPPAPADQEIVAVPKAKVTGRGRSRVPVSAAAAAAVTEAQVISPRQRRIARAGVSGQVPVQVSPRSAAAAVAAATAANAEAVAAAAAAAAPAPYESRNAYSRPPVAWQPYTVGDYKRLPPVRSDHGLGPDLQNEKLLQKKAQADAVKRVAEDVRRTNRERLSRAAPAPKPIDPEPPIHTSKFARAREFAKKIPLPNAKGNAGAAGAGGSVTVTGSVEAEDGSADILDESSAQVGGSSAAIMNELNQKHEQLRNDLAAMN